ncbi:DUF3566 domain-containing protein [Gryllotalpicola sp.]|uniref:DUF3566 domain-containing protein n=1 Tax=Gryllotalpicola sp. TaxID=1932787 RepID=UPI002611F88E|nr:DUF3566 domain-containing protein [Gryllotalpicola sp.]
MSSVAAKLARKPARPVGAKQVRLRLVYIDFWSAVKLSFLASLVIAIVGIVVSFILWTILNNFGVFDSLSGLVAGIANTGGKSVTQTFSLGTVMAGSVVIGILDVIIYTALGAIIALLYNLSVKITGGLLVGFTNN